MRSPGCATVLGRSQRRHYFARRRRPRPGHPPRGRDRSGSAWPGVGVAASRSRRRSRRRSVRGVCRQRRRRLHPGLCDRLVPRPSDQQQRDGDREMTRVGWVGLGAMGGPMAACVARVGHDVIAYDVDPSRADALATEGVKAAYTIAQAARDADVLVVMVATPAQVEDVLYGDDPAASELQPGAVVLIMATVGPAAV